MTVGQIIGIFPFRNTEKVDMKRLEIIGGRKKVLVTVRSVGSGRRYALSEHRLPLIKVSIRPVGVGAGRVARANQIYKEHKGCGNPAFGILPLTTCALCWFMIFMYIFEFAGS